MSNLLSKSFNLVFNKKSIILVNLFSTILFISYSLSYKHLFYAGLDVSIIKFYMVISSTLFLVSLSLLFSLIIYSTIKFMALSKWCN